jgi:transposase
MALDSDTTPTRVQSRILSGGRHGVVDSWRGCDAAIRTDRPRMGVDCALDSGARGDGTSPSSSTPGLEWLFWILRSGVPWRDLPERYGPWQSVYHPLNPWRRQGVFDRVLEAPQIRLDAEGYIDWDLWCVDGSSIRASRAGARAGKGGAAKNPKTTRWVARAADSGASSTA